MNRKAGHVKDIILDEIEKREDELKRYILVNTELEDHPFFIELLAGNLKTAYRKAKSFNLKQVVAEIGQSVEAKLKVANEAHVVEEIRQYAINKGQDRLQSMIDSIITNQARLMIKGNWSRPRGVKGFSNLVTTAIKLYRKELPLSSHIASRVSRITKTKVAEHLLDWYFDQIEERVEDMGGVYDILDMSILLNPDRVLPKSLEVGGRNLSYEDFLNLLLKARKKMRFDPDVYLNYDPPPSGRRGYLRAQVQVTTTDEDTRTPLLLSFDIKSDQRRSLEKDIERVLQAVSMNT